MDEVTGNLSDNLSDNAHLRYDKQKYVSFTPRDFESVSKTAKTLVADQSSNSKAPSKYRKLYEAERKEATKLKKQLA